jgi:hypothetical protein
MWNFRGASWVRNKPVTILKTALLPSITENLPYDSYESPFGQHVWQVLIEDLRALASNTIPLIVCIHSPRSQL